MVHAGVGLRLRLMFLLTSLRCDDNERALISSMTIAMGTLVIVNCGVSGTPFIR